MIKFKFYFKTCYFGNLYLDSNHVFFFIKHLLINENSFILFFQIQSDKSGIHTLKLKQARTKDAGVYKIRAFTSAGSVDSQATLFIKSMLNPSTDTVPVPSS